MENVDITRENLERENELNWAIHETLRGKKETYHLKYRSLWLGSNNRNTSFFHKQDKGPMNINTIKEIYDLDRKIII